MRTVIATNDILDRFTVLAADTERIQRVLERVDSRLEPTPVVSDAQELLSVDKPVISDLDEFAAELEAAKDEGEKCIVRWQEQNPQQVSERICNTCLLTAFQTVSASAAALAPDSQPLPARRFPSVMSSQAQQAPVSDLDGPDVEVTGEV